MIRKVSRVHARLAEAFVGGVVNVSALCQELGISRQTYYAYRARFEMEGLDGLVVRSRRPRRSPGKSSEELEQSIVDLRKRLHDEGLDYGAQAIRFRLRRDGVDPLPAVATIHRVLVRRGLVDPMPQRRPRSSWIRFVYPNPNDCWQIDATTWKLADGTLAWIFTLLDDHSRLVLACRVALAADNASAIDALNAAIRGHGLPGIVLSDNGTCFTGKAYSSSVAFERHVWAHAVRTITSRYHHPQTCGKIERWHQTLKKWLRRRPPAASLEQLQDQLTEFALIYNTTRPHAALDGRTPAEAYAATPKHHHDPDQPSTAPTRAAQRRANIHGQFRVNECLVHLGAKYRDQSITVFVTANYVAVYHDGAFLGDVDLKEGQGYTRLNFATKINKNVSAMS
jgi:transposase InsO family protein